MDRLLMMILNRVMRGLINRGIRAGLDKATGAPKRQGPKEGNSTQIAYQTGRRVRQVAKIARRMMR